MCAPVLSDASHSKAVLVCHTTTQTINVHFIIEQENDNCRRTWLSIPDWLNAVGVKNAHFDFFSQNQRLLSTVVSVHALSLAGANGGNEKNCGGQCAK